MALFDLFHSKSDNQLSMNNKAIRRLDYCGPQYSVARFRIDKSLLPIRTDALLVAQEGHCIDEGMLKIPHGYTSYHEIQHALGNGMTLIEKEHSSILKRNLFLYQFNWLSDKDDYLLAFPATGEEVYFEIYAMDTFNVLHLLLHCEL